MSARFRRLSSSFALCVGRLKISSNGLPEEPGGTKLLCLVVSSPSSEGPG